MCLTFHWFYLKSRSFLLVYVGVISDSYTDYFLSRCLSKTTTELATMCKHKPKKPSFLDLREFAGFCGRFADFCGMFAGRFGRVFLFFCRFCVKVLCTEKVGGVAESDLHTQLQCTTLAASKNPTYMRGKREENIMKYSKLSNFHGFWAFQFLITIQKKTGDFNHNW